MQKLFFFGTIFSIYWFVKRHPFKPPAFHSQLNYDCDVVIITVPQICVYFVDNPHNLEIDSFKIAVSEHVQMYYYILRIQSFFFCVHMIMCGTRCVSWCTFVFDR